MSDVSVVNRYRDAYRLAAACVGLGGGIKIAGGVLAGAVFVVVPEAKIGIPMAAIVGTLFWLAGVIVSAQGEILRATLDNAVASSHFLSDPERAEAMGLPRSTAERLVSKSQP
jgi:hypothetical protein